ncbi:hypothetical protein BCU68_13000 [Vibrio sp. 10N.286.49.B3]|uniref:hypothetical protein n=1 Tax=Vibrio sp. 10N.286.49.B3 TaxID=1880855 RepID=UPI000C85BC20|nr:hypothetical protein [Vibrio sp. 10N.286.49.B3]PMH43763.1 hypothetical protein BCU68_13000 [Vibrio sp. 10N.286.49.B3]
MNKFVMGILIAFFSLRLFASVGPHIEQLEHDSFTLIRSAILIGGLLYASNLVFNRFKAKQDKNDK